MTSIKDRRPTRSWTRYTLGVLWLEWMIIGWLILRLDGYARATHWGWCDAHPNLFLLLIAGSAGCLGAALSPLAVYVGWRLEQFLKTG